MHSNFLPRRFSFALLLMGALVLLLGWLMFGRVVLQPVQAAVRCVNPGGTSGCFATIGAAVAAAAAGDTINVAAGTYNEQVNLNKANLILRGAQGGVSACGRPGNVNETIITHTNGPLQITADNVTVEGVTLQGATSGLTAGLYVTATYSGHRILNNIVQNNVIGLFLNSNGANATLVQGNRIRNNTNPGSSNGTGIYSNSQLSNTTLRQNCFSGQTTASILFDGVSPCNPNLFTGLTIADNSAQGERFLELVCTKNVTISGNRIADPPLKPSATSERPGISIGGGNADVVVEGNSITSTLNNQNTSPAILVRNRANALNSNVTVRCNRIAGNLGGGLTVDANAYNGPVVAENNWWGCNAGPGGTGCDVTTGNVDATPWLVMGLTVPTSGVRNGQTPLTVNFQRNSANQPVTCDFAEGTPVNFVSTCGTPSPSTAFPIKGEAKATLTPTSSGSCNVTATVDKQSLSSALTVLDGGPEMTLMSTSGCIGPGTHFTVTVRFTNTSSLPQNVTIVATLSPAMSTTGGLGCSAVNGTCTSETNSVIFSGTLAPGQEGSVQFLAQVDVGGTGEELPVTATVNLSGSTASVTKVLRLTCPNLIPGFPLPLSEAAANAQRPGSVLIYSIYTSSASAANIQNTRLSLTNTSTTSVATVHLFFVSRDSCQSSDVFVCLTPNQTVSFLASDIDPGTTGYVIAVAVDRETGCPVQFNNLIGDEFVKFASGHQANLGAEAIAALNGQPAVCDGLQRAELRFNGVSYSMLPAIVALDSVPSRADNNNTLWFLVRLDGNLATDTFTQTTLNGTLYDDAEASFSIGNYSILCQLTGTILPGALVGGGRFDTVVPAGRTGWLKLNLAGTTPRGLLGAQINFNPNTRSNSNAYSQGHLLHKLSLTNNTVLTIPVMPPTC